MRTLMLLTYLTWKNVYHLNSKKVLNGSYETVYLR